MTYKKGNNIASKDDYIEFKTKAGTKQPKPSPMYGYNQDHLYGNTDDPAMLYDNVNLNSNNNNNNKATEEDHYMSYLNPVQKEDTYMALNNTNSESAYDLPKSESAYDLPKSESAYDSPKQIQQQSGDTYDTPKNLLRQQECEMYQSTINRQQECGMYQAMQDLDSGKSPNDLNTNKPTPLNDNIYGNLVNEDPLYGNIQSTFN